MHKSEAAMKFPPIDEPTTIAINAVITECVNARRLFRVALETDLDVTIRPLLAQGDAAYARIVAELREGLFDSAGEAVAGGTAQGFLRRVRENVGQRTGWRDRQQLIDSLVDQQRRTLAAFDAASEKANGARFETILAAKRAVVAGMAAQLEAMAADV